MTRAVTPAKRINDRRRSGVGDNVAFTASSSGVGGLGAGKRISALVTPSIAQHQYTNRGSARMRNGKGKKTV